MTPVLSVAGVSKRYGAATVLSDVSLEIGRGEVVGLVGANGAGKSTLIRILSGVTRPTAGRVLLDGTPVSPAGPLEAQRAGVQTVHQHIDDGIVPGATVAENLILDGGSPARGWLVTRRRTREAAERVARAARLDLPLNAPVDGLPPGPRQQIVLARALAHRPRVLILDEPTSALSAAESDLLLATVRRLAADGVAVLYVSHRLQEIRELCDRVAVLRDGELRAVLHAPVEGSRLVAEMLGERLAAQARHEVRSGGDPVLRATGVRTRPGAEPFDLTVRAGEVVGLTGLIGAGKTELLEQLYGVRPLVSGALELGGRPYRPRDPAAAVAAGVALTPEEREAQAVLPGWSVRAHVSLPRLSAHSRFGLLSRRSEAAAARQVIEAFAVRGPGPGAAIGTLSGGNQQKVIVARRLGDARLILLDEPFRGVDVGAQADIAARVRERAAGAGVIVAAADPQEVLQFADRVVVLHEGARTGELSAADVTPGRLAELMSGGRATDDEEGRGST